ncbi:MAG: putative metal-binding motif-containing protein [Polyangiaceae bacterium]|nr:putative metal-binding motif-containing protein [Polyangiaceae bacterium]
MQLTTCSSCRGFLPPGSSSCPHCQKSAAAAGASPGLAAKLLAVASGGMMAVTLMACYGMPPCDDPGTDSDGDGYSMGGCGYENDCDDSDASIHPYAQDPLGDGIDQNCDGADGDEGMSSSSSGSGGMGGAGGGSGGMGGSGGSGGMGGSGGSGGMGGSGGN